MLFVYRSALTSKARRGSCPVRFASSAVLVVVSCREAVPWRAVPAVLQRSAERSTN